MHASKLRVYHRLQVAAHAARKAADRVVLEAAGVTTAQAAVLTIVAASESVTQRDVATALRFNESAITAMVSRLLKLGLLCRSRSETDSRVWRLSLTSTGRAALQASGESFASINACVEGELSLPEMRQLADLLDRLTDAFKD
jgi:DNA-binding MarR family transcriptional regulator